MMKFFAAILAMVLVSATARAVVIDGLRVIDLGVPACAQPNPLPSVVNGGTFYPRLPTPTGDLRETVNPWTEYGSRFPGATYSAIYADFDSFGRVSYDFTEPQTSMTVGVGTPDAGESIFFRSGTDTSGHPIGKTLQMADILAVFGFRDGIYLKVTMPAGKTFTRATFSNVWEGAAFEIFDVNAVCK